MATTSYEAQAERASLWLLYLVPTLFTGLCGLFLLHEAYITYNHYHNGVFVVGTVQAVRNESNTDADWTSYDVSFKTPDGQIHTITNHYNTVDNPSIYQVGQAVRVVYLPEDADAGRLNSAREKYGVITGLLGMVFLGSGVLAFLFSMTRRSAAKQTAGANQGH
jgi:hypothetical protein